MSKFTEDEKIIAKHIDKKYKWMARDKSGDLFIYHNKPTKSINGIEWIIEGVWGHLFGFEYLFKSVTWEDAEPTLIKGIYDPQILDDAEREYLTAVLKPLPKVKEIHKTITFTENFEYLVVRFCNADPMVFPYFAPRRMYKGMELDKPYTPEELGIKL